MNQDFEIRIPREISDFKEEFYFGLNIRQLLSVILSLGISFFIYYNFYSTNKNLVEYIIILVCVPILAIGFINYNHLSFEQLLVLILRQLLIFSKPIFYKQSDNQFIVSLATRKEKFNEIKKNKKPKKA